ncbi:dipeptide ABC transporter ATP-binding protein [Streptosporangium amethystogenes]|uniref:dipeptide ABC transporter ATP-binding protein n=1 Tax=Streptosporangium amethystogenes TaxID=2002 RepID=UPI0004CBA29B|nr:dipeptide ABC transporter ATP-binding protein [Streptosporangium amethystogenes]
MSTQPLLRLTDLRVGYGPARRGGDRHETDAVRGVSLRVDRGETVALVGESGSGKSSTAHAVNGLLPATGRISAGRVHFGGQDITGWPDRAMRHLRGAEIGFIPQDPAVALNPVRRIGHQVADVLLLHGRATRRNVRGLVEKILEEAGLPDPADYARRYPHELSGGMRQRVLIGIALACAPRLVIADEPTSALDVTVQRRILDHIQRLTSANGTAVLLITHDLGVAADRADRIVVMREGLLVEQGPTERILGDPRHAYTRRLLGAVPTLTGPTLIATSSPRPEAEAAPESPLEAGPNPEPRPEPRSRPEAGPNPEVPHLESRPRPETDTEKTPESGTVPAPLLELRGVTKEFKRAASVTVAVSDVDLVVGRGRTVGLVGESGSGKSTTARMALRLEAPTRGRVLFDGVDITTATRGKLRPLRRRFQPVYQNPFASLDPRLSVSALIDEPLDAFGEGDRAARRRRVAELVDQVALPSSVLDRHATELSGGQRQRVAIARALVLRPELMVLDEPVSALDVSVQDQILRLLVELQARLGLSYLFISHDLAVVRQIAHEVTILRSGSVVESGPAERVFDNPHHSYTKELLMAVPGRLNHGADTSLRW